MTLPTSGPLSLQQIAKEFQGNDPVSLSQYYAGGTLVPPGTVGTNGPVPSSGPISIWNFYGTSSPVDITYYLIGAGGTSSNDTSGGASGAGAAVGKLSVISGIPAIITVGQQGAAANGAQGGTTSIIYNGSTIAYATGGFGNGGPPCGFCSGPVQYSVGHGYGGSLQLSGGYGGGWNNNPPGGAGGSGTFNGVAYYAAGGGGSGADFGQTDNPGGSGGGAWAGAGGAGHRSGHGGAGGAYGGGGGGSGNYYGGAGAGAGGVSVITYISPTQRATGGTVTSSGSGASTVWQHVFTSSGSFVAN